MALETLPAGSTILNRVAAGDVSATRECLDRYGDLVWAMARRYLRNRGDAEDAVQDVFIDVWHSAARYDSSIGSEITFIATIARRRIIDRIRRTARSPVMDSLDDEDCEFAEPGVPATSEHDAEIALVERALGTLDPRHQQVLALSLLEGFTHQEIAERFAMPVGTVKTWIRRGLIHVRGVLRIPATGVAAGPLRVSQA